MSIGSCLSVMKDLLVNASESVKRANPQLLALDKHREIKTRPARSSRDWRARMNKTESDFALILDGEKQAGRITRYIYEGLTLRWGDGMRYTPDFVAFPSFPGAPPMMIEVKGGHIWDRDIVRFKGAKASWPEFGFQMWQRKNGQWKKKY